MRVIKTRLYDGKNIYADRKCIRIDVELEGCGEILDRDIEKFDFQLFNLIPKLQGYSLFRDKDIDFVKENKKTSYLVSLCGYIIIAIQNKIGIKVSYGASRRISDDCYYIVVEYIYPQVAVEIINLAVDIINLLIDKSYINYDERIVSIKAILDKEHISKSAEIICKAAKEIGMPVTKLGCGDLYQLGYGKQSRLIEGDMIDTTSCIAVEIVRDKLLTKELLELNMIPIAKGYKVYNLSDLLKKAEKIGYPLILKPQYKSEKKNAIVTIKNKKELVYSYDYIRKNFEDIIVEEYCEGKDYRILIIDDEVIDVSLKGEDKIFEVDICKENKEICMRIANVLGLDICCIDIRIEDISKAIYNTGIIVDVDARLGFESMVGDTTRDIGKAIVNMMYEGNISNIPVVAVTGAIAKTIITGIVSHTISRIGYKVGTASAEGVYINDKYICENDDVGYRGAKNILLNNEVDIAVLEVTRRGIIERGLAYDLADVAVVTNITEAHLGIKQVEGENELYYAEFLVAETVKKSGYLIINAEDKFSREVIARSKSKMIFFSKQKDNEIIRKEIECGGIVVYLEEGYITVSNNSRVYKVCKDRDIPIMLDDRLNFNIEGVLAATAALVGMNVDYCMISNGLKSYVLN